MNKNGHVSQAVFFTCITNHTSFWSHCNWFMLGSKPSHLIKRFEKMILIFTQKTGLWAKNVINAPTPFLAICCQPASTQLRCVTHDFNPSQPVK